PPHHPTYTLSLHDALPISCPTVGRLRGMRRRPCTISGQFLTHLRFKPRKCSSFLTPKIGTGRALTPVCCSHGSRLPPDSPSFPLDRKSTRLNSSHVKISYA